ncbi:hypothetical protein [Pedococcus soli]
MNALNPLRSSLYDLFVEADCPCDLPHRADETITVPGNSNGAGVVRAHGSTVSP